MRPRLQRPIVQVWRAADHDPLRCNALLHQFPAMDVAVDQGTVRAMQRLQGIARNVPVHEQRGGYATGRCDAAGRATLDRQIIADHQYFRPKCVERGPRVGHGFAHHRQISRHGELHGRFQSPDRGVRERWNLPRPDGGQLLDAAGPFAPCLSHYARPDSQRVDRAWIAHLQSLEDLPLAGHEGRGDTPLGQRRCHWKQNDRMRDIARPQEHVDWNDRRRSTGRSQFSVGRLHLVRPIVCSPQRCLRGRIRRGRSLAHGVQDGQVHRRKQDVESVDAVELQQLGPGSRSDGASQFVHPVEDHRLAH